jgi:hypothetical protein
VNVALFSRRRRALFLTWVNLVDGRISLPRVLIVGKTALLVPFSLKTSPRTPALASLVTLAIRSQLDGGQRRLEPQLRKRIAILSGGETSQTAVSFANGHVKTYKDGLKITDGIWLPQDLSTKDTVFYWNRAVIPWKFILEQSTTGAEAVTMSGLLGALGIGSVVNPPVNPLATGANETVSLAAQVAQLRQLVEGLVRPGGPTQDVSEAGRVAAAALQGARQGGSDNPSNIFNLSGNNNTAVGSANMNIPPSQQQVGSNADAELVKALAAAGVPPTQIAQILQSRVAPAQPMEHRNAWFQVAEGTSPLCIHWNVRRDAAVGHAQDASRSDFRGVFLQQAVPQAHSLARCQA